MEFNKRPVVFIFISAALFGISTPLAKLLVKDIPPIALAGFLYLGAFIGISLFSIGRAVISARRERKTRLAKGDIPWLAGAILSGGILAPISLMFGLQQVSGFAASLLLNLEGMATAVIAMLFFKEDAGRRVWLALVCMTIAGVFLAWDPGHGTFTFGGPLLVTFAMVCWGMDNNLTRQISAKDPLQITRTKGLISGVASLSLAYALGMNIQWSETIFYALLLGSFSYGVSLVFFIKALDGMGSFRTGVFFSLAPFMGALTSLVFLGEWLGWVMFPATFLTVVGVWFIVTEKHSHLHVHTETTHTHLHNHQDLHHTHEHFEIVSEPHVHAHKHHAQAHIHVHWPDMHHRHEHES